MDSRCSVSQALRQAAHALFHAEHGGCGRNGGVFDLLARIFRARAAGGPALGGASLPAVCAGSAQSFRAPANGVHAGGAEPTGGGHDAVFRNRRQRGSSRAARRQRADRPQQGHLSPHLAHQHRPVSGFPAGGGKAASAPGGGSGPAHRRNAFHAGSAAQMGGAPVQPV